LAERFFASITRPTGNSLMTGSRHASEDRP